MASTLDNTDLLVLHISSRIINDIWKNFAGDSTLSFPGSKPKGEEYMQMLCTNLGMFAESIRDSDKGGPTGKALSGCVREYYKLVEFMDQELSKAHKEV